MQCAGIPMHKHSELSLVTAFAHGFLVYAFSATARDEKGGCMLILERAGLSIASNAAPS